MRVSEHPVCGIKVGFAEIFLMPQPPHEEGNNLAPNIRAQFIHAGKFFSVASLPFLEGVLPA